MAMSRKGAPMPTARAIVDFGMPFVFCHVPWVVSVDLAALGDAVELEGTAVVAAAATRGCTRAMADMAVVAAPLLPAPEKTAEPSKLTASCAAVASMTCWQRGTTRVGPRRRRVGQLYCAESVAAGGLSERVECHDKMSGRDRDRDDVLRKAAGDAISIVSSDALRARCTFTRCCGVDCAFGLLTFPIR